jgi:sugar phosphate isomerase/epimerase
MPATNAPRSSKSNDAPSLPLAVQLYSLRSLTIPLAERLSQVAAMGYTGVEMFGPLEPPADQLADLLHANGLKLVSAHVGIDLLERDLDGVIAYHKAVGNDVLVVPWIGPDRRGDSAESWASFGRNLDAIGARCRAAGMRLLYHNHDFEMVRFDGKTAMECLLDAATPANVGAEFDLAWMVKGGGDPVALLHQYAGRCARVHAKDLARPGESAGRMGLADVGHGVLDWDAILPAVHAAGAEWLIVEHDEPADPLASMRRSYEFLSSKLG